MKHKHLNTEGEKKKNGNNLSLTVCFAQTQTYKGGANNQIKNYIGTNCAQNMHFASSKNYSTRFCWRATKKSAPKNVRCTFLERATNCANSKLLTVDKQRKLHKIRHWAFLASEFLLLSFFVCSPPKANQSKVSQVVLDLESARHFGALQKRRNNENDASNTNCIIFIGSQTKR